MNNKVIIIGDDHTNTLGVIRTFGENGIKPYVIIISKTKMVAVVKSKYVEKYWICPDENIALLTMISEFSEEKEKLVVIPTSDAITLKIDESYDKLRKKFIVPNINGKQGEIVRYMDKYNQYKLANENGINMAKSNIIDTTIDFNKLNINYSFPIVIKPIVSAYGNKSDIVICNNFEEFSLKYNDLKKYNQLLIQEYIDFDYECEIVGFAYEDNVCIPGITKKIRIWPTKKGSTTKGYILPSKNYEKEIIKIKELINELNYNGIIDIEIFIKNDKFYLNEINFRNSGHSYAYGDSYVCYYWYLSCVNKKIIESPNIKNEYYFMDDQADLHNVFERKISLNQYYNDMKLCNYKLVKNKNDKIPSRYMFMYKILKKCKIDLLLEKLSKILHKDKKIILLKSSIDKIKKVNNFNKNYMIIKIDENNINLLSNGSKADYKEFERLIKSKKVFGIVLKNDDGIIGHGLLKIKDADDKFVKIKNNNSYLISSLYVNEKFRGKNYQCDIIKELVNSYLKNKENNYLYAAVYYYNQPSLKNFEKIGFKKYNEIEIIRFMKKTINKEKI